MKGKINMAKKLVSLNMTEELISQIKELASQNSISFSAQVRLILLDYLKRINDGQKYL